MGLRFVACDPSSALLLVAAGGATEYMRLKTFGESRLKQKSPTEVEDLRFRMGLRFVVCDPSSALLLSPQAVQQSICA